MFLKIINKYSLLVFCAVLGLASVLSAQVNKEDVKELTNIDIVEHPGDTIPMDLTFIDDNGKTVKIGDYFNQGKPVLLMLGYYECPMLCNLVFNGVVQAGRDLKWSPGKDYLIVTVSINPNEDYHLAVAKKQNYLSALDKPGAENGWSFLTGDSTHSRELANTLGFQYYYDEEQKQYAHPAVLFVLTDKGEISRYFYGIEYKVNDMKLALLEASEGKIGTSLDRLILYCYHYDPNAGGYVIFAGNVMRLGGFVTVVILGLFVGRLFLKDRFKKKKIRKRSGDVNDKDMI